MITPLFLLLLVSTLPYSQQQVDHKISADGLKRAATILKESLNETVNPCDDFFEFTCSRWVQQNPIPKDRSYYDRYTKLSETISKQIKALYDDKTPSTSISINKLKSFYQKCMNTKVLNTMKTDELLSHLEEIGYWPIVHGDQWNAETFDLTEAMIRMAKIRALDVFFASYGNVDLNNVTRLLIHFDRGSLGMSIPHFYLDMKRFGVQFSAYKQYMNRVIHLIARDAKTNRTSSEIDADVEDIINFERKFAKMTVESMNTGNFSTAFRASRLGDMNSYVPSIKWLHYFLSVMPPEMADYIKSNPEVIIANPRFFIRLDKLLKETDNRTLMNVMGWRFSDAYWLQLDDRFGEVRYDYMRRVVGIQAKKPRWAECSAVMSAAMPYATDAMFIRKYFQTDDFHLVERLFGEVKTEFVSKLAKNRWMDDTTKAYALEKARAMEGLIGAPSFIYNDEELDKHYETLHWLPNDTYAAIVQKHSIWRQRTSSLKLLKPVDLSLFPMASTTVNAAYTFVRNALTIPGAILQAPFFDSRFPMSMNFGSIGSIISHEIVHGFDMQGSQFEKDGNRRNWWNPLTRERFVKRIKCIIDQYSDFEVKGTNGLHVNGIASNGENAADNSGISTSYHAYKKYLARHGSEPRIPGFEKYDNDQMFYISFAMSYCGHSKKEELIKQLFSDNHSPARYRINGVVSNQPEFSKAFNCPINSKMNPKKKCSIW